MTKKAKYILRFSPILKLNKVFISKNIEMVNLIDHYDPLAFGLRIIDIIINSTFVFNLTTVTGKTREGIFDTIKPFMEKIDVKKKKWVNEELKKKFVNKIIDTLLSPGRDKHQMDYIDYSSENYNWQSEPFQLLYLETNSDDEVQVMVSLEMINIFSNILELKIEDKRKAELYMLEQQIKRDDFKNALKTAHQYMMSTIVFMREVQDIIFKTQRKFKTIDWITEYPKKLKDAKNHISDCILKQKRLQDELLRRSYDITDESCDAEIIIEQLKQKLQKSFKNLLPLQSMVDEARDTFNIQSIQFFEVGKSLAFELERDFLPEIFISPVEQVDNILNEFLVQFSKPTAPRIVSLNSTVDLFFRLSEQQRKSRLREKKTKKRKRKRELKRSVLSAKKYSRKLRKSVIEDLFHILESEGIHSLSGLLDLFVKNGRSPEEQDYLVLYILGNYAKDNFEGRYTKKRISVDLNNKCISNEFFEGADYSIEIQK